MQKAIFPFRIHCDYDKLSWMHYSLRANYWESEGYVMTGIKSMWIVATCFGLFTSVVVVMKLNSQPTSTLSNDRKVEFQDTSPKKDSVTDQSKALQPDLSNFRKTIRPFLSKHCYSCHGKEVRKADLRLDNLEGNLLKSKQLDLWQDMLRRVELSEMPPSRKPQPTNAERRLFVNWVRRELEKVNLAAKGVPGRVVIRRLSKNEYRNTLRDLLGLHCDVGKDLPPDTLYHGFDHVAAVQEFSPQLLETYLELARYAIDKAVVSGHRPLTYQYRSEPEEGPKKTQWRILTHGLQENETAFVELKKTYSRNRDSFPPNPNEWFHTYRMGMSTGARGKNKIVKNGVWLPASHNVYEDQFNPWGILRYTLPKVPRGNVRYRLRVKAGADRREGMGNPLLTIHVFKKLLADVEIDAPAENSRWYEFIFTEKDLIKMAYRQRDSRFRNTRQTDLVLNNSYENPGVKKRSWQLDKNVKIPALFIDAVEFEAHYYESWPPPSHKKILFDSPNRDDPQTYASEVLTRFMSAAYRRPVRPNELERKMKLFRTIYSKEKDFISAIKEPLAATLISPQFLFINEDHSLDEKKRRPLNDYELASRLSYYLWSTMPDEELLQLAAKGKLTNPQILERQVDRMLKDKRANAFHHGFMTQWLRLDKLDALMIDDDRWVISHQLKQAMWEEPVQLFAEMLNKDLSLLTFIDSDFAMLNERLAIHYNIPNVYGYKFRPVKLSEGSHRGGLLTQAACMTISTDGMITNPIYRGVWVMETILDRPPPNAPANVPPLDDAPKIRLSLREQLAKHRIDPNCSSCHDRIDPIGWPFERYSVLGEYSDLGWGPNWAKFREERSRKKGEKPDMHGILPDKTRVENVSDLQRFFSKNYSRDVLRSVTKNMLIYALGRPLDLSDEPTIESIITQLEQRQLRTRELIRAVVLSEPFLEK